MKSIWATLLNFLAIVLLFSTSVNGQNIDNSPDRVDVNVILPYHYIGTLVPKNISETKNNITLGCETLDRDYADYHAYKSYLAPLGIKKIRLQAGWAKTEKQKGVYDFKWLDEIINDAIGRGLIVWLQTSYGNPIYDGGGTAVLGAQMPSSDEGKKAWNNWVEAMALRYKGKNIEWEIWNEPDHIPISDIVELNVRTAEIIKKIQPDAKIAALAYAGIHPDKVEQCLSAFKELNKLSLFSWVSYHGYEYRPEDSYPKVEKLRSVLKKYSTEIKLRQGENGAPSRGNMGGGLANYPWNEVTQAKWNLRRMLGDHGRDIETSVFTIADIAYASNDYYKKLNVKGLLETAEDKKIKRPKIAYYSVQNLAAIFDLLNHRIKSYSYKSGTEASISLFGFEDDHSKLQHFVLWYDKATPANFNITKPVNIEIENGNFNNPVWVDLLSGKVYKIPKSTMVRKSNSFVFSNLPVYDSPVLVVDKSFIDYKR